MKAKLTPWFDASKTRPTLPGRYECMCRNSAFGSRDSKCILRWTGSGWSWNSGDFGLPCDSWRGLSKPQS